MFYLCLTLALFDVFVYAGDGPLLRNFVIASGALKPLLALAHNSMNNVSNIHARGFSYDPKAWMGDTQKYYKRLIM